MGEPDDEYEETLAEARQATDDDPENAPGSDWGMIEAHRRWQCAEAKVAELEALAREIAASPGELTLNEITAELPMCGRMWIQDAARAALGEEVSGE